MTLGMAWIRNVGRTQELVFAIDSRLNGGRRWDGCPKLLMLPRSDSVICFAGETDDAYPLMIQVSNAISMFPKALSGALDITDLKGHLLRVFQDTRRRIHGLPKGQQFPDDVKSEFVFGGYSWKERGFRFWRIGQKGRKFFSEPPKNWSAEKDKKLIIFIGDKTAIDEATKRLSSLLRSKEKIDRGDFDMEPFEVLRDIIRSDSVATVGGAPQLVKIYQNMNAVPFALYWPSRSDGTVAVLGRQLLDYEITNWPVIDPDDVRFGIGQIVTPRIQRSQQAQGSEETLDESSDRAAEYGLDLV